MPKSSALAKLTLEGALRALANAGELTHLSIIPRAGKGPGGVVFSASYSPASKWGQGFGDDPDPVNAIMKAITNERFAELLKTLKLDTAGLPVVEAPKFTQAERALMAGAPAPTPDEPPTDEDWLKAT